MPLPEALFAGVQTDAGTDETLTTDRTFVPFGPDGEPLGGVPPHKQLGDGAVPAGNQIRRVMGVMNGSCNYILTRMQSENLPYEAVFEEARQLGYLEADPNLDVGGIDAGHKLALLASIAFGTKVSFGAVELEGIGSVSIDDIRLAEDMGYRIKLLGVAQMTGRGLEQGCAHDRAPVKGPSPSRSIAADR